MSNHSTKQNRTQNLLTMPSEVSDNNTDDVSVKMISLLREIRKWVEAFGSYELPKQNDIIDAKRIGMGPSLFEF